MKSVSRIGNVTLYDQLQKEKHLKEEVFKWNQKLNHENVLLYEKNSKLKTRVMELSFLSFAVGIFIGVLL